MTFEQFTKRFNEMFPDRRLWDETQELGLDRMQFLYGGSKNEFVEKMTFCLVMSICQALIETGEEVVDDLTDALLCSKEHILNAPAGKSCEITMKPELFVKSKEQIKISLQSKNNMTRLQ